MISILKSLIFNWLRLMFGLNVVPASISGNATSTNYAEELLASPGILSAGPWFGMEPNTFQDFGASISKVARAPIVSNRQRPKGTITDLDVKAGFNTDLTQRNITRLLQGFFFADILEKPATQPINGTQVPITSVDITAGNHYNAAANMPVFLVNQLVNAKGFANAGNNGLKLVSARTATILTTTTAGEVVEAAPPSVAQIEAVGYQYAAGDLVLTIVNGQVVLTSTAIDPTTLGLNIGEWIWIGGDGAGNQFVNNAPFIARVASVNAAAKTIALDFGFKAIVADAGAAKTIQIFFGKFLVNQNTLALIKARSYSIERQLGNDGAGIQAEYALGCYANELTVNMPSNNKSSVDMSFVGMNVLNNSGAVGIAPGTRNPSPFETALNTSHDLVTAFIGIVDNTVFNDTALFGFATDVKLMVKNNVSPNKALGVLGAFGVTVGDFEVSGTMTAYFSTIAAAAAIRANADVSLSLFLASKNSGQVFDMPLLQLGGGLNKVEKDKPIVVDITMDAAKCVNNYTASWTFFEYLPTIAIPV